VVLFENMSKKIIDAILLPILKKITSPNSVAKNRCKIERERRKKLFYVYRLLKKEGYVQ